MYLPLQPLPFSIFSTAACCSHPSSSKHHYPLLLLPLPSTEQHLPLLLAPLSMTLVTTWISALIEKRLDVYSMALIVQRKTKNQKD
jgi:hypothetical protein